MVKKMNKRGVTILELLISIILISTVILLLLKVMFSLENINNDQSYASSDEISRTEIIKTIENDFLTLKLNGIEIVDNKITFYFKEASKTLTIDENKIIYGEESYSLNSANATYDACVNYKYESLENDYYLINLNIPVLIDGKNTTAKDDLTLVYIGLLNEDSNYLLSYVCSKK